LRLTLPDALGLAERNNATLQAAAARQDGAVAAGVTARQYPNPELELHAGPIRPRGVGGPDGNAFGFTLAQPLDYANVREARARVADSSVDAAEAGVRTVRRLLYAKVKLSFFQILQRQEQARLADEELTVLQQIRDRVNLRVQLGEAPRLDLIRADTELLTARRNRDSARLRTEQARGALAALLGLSGGQRIEVEGTLPRLANVPPLAYIRDRALKTNPDLTQIEAEQRRARARLDLETRLRTPQVTLRAGHDTEPDQTRWRLGLSVPLPLFNQRQGQIREALAETSLADAQFESRRQLLLGELDLAFNGFALARQQVDAFEGGLLKQAEQTLRVAEAAYRFGERGIFEFLDAQRTLRLVRQDYINALYEARYALLEIERLVGVDLLEETR
jgi:outer membrane protein, heavy metal efflux system